MTDESTPEPPDRGSSDEEADAQAGDGALPATGVPEPREVALNIEDAESPQHSDGPTRVPILTDAEIHLKGKQVELEQKEADLAKKHDELETEKDNRKLRKYVANGALLVMLAQIVAANATFVWYGDTNDWDIPPAAISVWMGATVIQVVSVVLVITNYLFPNPKKKEDSS